MRNALVNLVGEGVATALIWIVAGLILLLLVLIIVRIARSMSSGTFVAGGRNRAPRLAVVDAAAVDNQRRLVLVRRDDVEHLILIGGPSDVVIEQHIRASHLGEASAMQPQRRERAVPPRPAESTQAAARPRPASAPQTPPRPEPPLSRSERVLPERPAQPESAPTIPPPPVDAGPPARPQTEALRAAPPVQHETPRPAAVPQQASRGEREPELPNPRRDDEEPGLRDIDLSMDELRHQARSEELASHGQDLALEDEMSRLLDELSEEKEKKES